MTWVIPSVIATLCGTFVLTLVYWHLYSQYRERYIGIWAVGWSVYTVRFVFELLMNLHPEMMVLVVGQQLATLVSGIFVLWGTHAFLGKPVSRWMVYGAILDTQWMISGISLHASWLVLNLPTFIFMGLIYCWTGVVLLRSRDIKGFGKQFTGWAFILWGIHKANYPFIKTIAWLAPIGYLTAALLELTVAIGTLLVYFQKVRQDLGSGEERFRLLAENAQDMIYRYRFKPVRGFEYVSPSATAIIGYTPEEHYADPDLIFKVVHPDDQHLLHNMPLLTGEKKEKFFLRSIRKDGKIISTEHRTVPIYDKEGNIICFEGIARDITESKQAEESLRESERRFREMLENVRLVTVTLDRQGNIAFCNGYLLELTGWQQDEVTGQNWFATFIPDQDSERWEQLFLEKMSESGTPVNYCYENEIQTRQGEKHTISWNSIILRDSLGRAIGTTSIGEDISERKKAEEVLKRYQLLSERARDIILFIQRDGCILEANNAAVNAYGFQREEMLAQNIYDLRAPEAKSSLDHQISKGESEGALYETLHQRRDGTVFPVEVSLQGAFIGNQQVLLAIIRDITERKRAEEIINHLAYHDPLTDLPNRLLFYDRLTVALADAQRNGGMLAVMFLDLDRFKYVNDMMGHAIGDQLLKDVARQLTGCVRKNDTVARIGGDEFTILLPYISHEEDAARVAEKIIDTLKKPWVVNGQEFQITSSVGIVLYPNDGESAETLTTNADTAMYRAKEEGDNYQFYTPAMNIKAMERLSMEQALRKAVEQKEFVVHYQPQVDIKSGRIIGVEALVRWQHPERGLVLPMEFIPLAEDTGLIVPMGEWVLRTVCAQNKAWQEAGYPPMRVAVNLSACQFRQRQLVETIDEVIKETGMDPGLLELEITESTAMEDVEFSIGMLKSVKEMGIRIAIDDFGTGYSSLSYLRRFPITTLKIDRSFVRDVLTDVEDAAIVATIIVLAQNLKLKVVVEGVETEEQLAFFEQQECFEMQGYLFSKPVPAEGIEKLLKKASAIALKA